jgi:protein involved in polysaccharide export with SLBB domain
MATEKDKSLPPDATPKAAEGAKLPAQPKEADAELLIRKDERQRQAQEIRAMKAKEGGPRRFGQDLFESREEMTDVAEGGVGEDYVLGVGDQMLVAGFGSATFEVPAVVSGRGEVLIPKVGNVAVSGLSLGRAKAAIQGKVNRVLAGTSVELSVTKLRQVRVFVLGEVYKPGGFLVPSLSSLVNVLGLAGGPTALGSFRQIRVMRGGKLLHQVDLYPLRAEGMGNLNLSLQTGDTVFVPLIFNPVLLEGGFLRVAGREADRDPGANRIIDPRLKNRQDDRKSKEQAEDRPSKSRMDDRLPKDRTDDNRSKDRTDDNRSKGRTEDGRPRTRLQEGTGDLEGNGSRFGDGKLKARQEDDGEDPDTLIDAPLPSMQFELLPGETAQDALRFAGRLMPNVYAGGLTLRRQDRGGATSVVDLSTERLGAFELQAGDVLSALPRRDQLDAMVSVAGWARVPGTFARTEGLRVGDLLKHPSQIMPDTYLQRGDIIRTLKDGSTRFLSFDVARALEGQPADNLLLEDRDRVQLHRISRMRLPKRVTLSGPFTQAGVYEFHEGMRVADLVFMAGVPEKRANRMEAELARSRDGRPSEIRKLDLSKVLSSETGSPVNLTDEALNPMLQDDDQITIYEKPEFRVHRTVTIRGQVAKPGLYVLDAEHPTLSQLIKRAGGLTKEAMPQAGIFFRNPLQGAASPGSSHVSETSGISEILDRLNETKIFDFKGEAKVSAAPTPSLFKIPVLHGLGTEKLNRVVVDFPAAMAGKVDADIELNDQDEIIIPRQTDTVMIIGETATPFAFYRVKPGMSVGDLLALAGGTTRNADARNIRLLKADGRIVDSWVKGKAVEPGDAVLVPQVVRRATNWQENLSALTPLAILINAIRW